MDTDNVVHLSERADAKLMRLLRASNAVAKPGMSSSEIRARARELVHELRQKRAAAAEKSFVLASQVALAAVFADPVLMLRLAEWSSLAAEALETARVKGRALESAIDEAAKDTDGLDALIELAEESAGKEGT